MTIKETAGKILLVLYSLHSSNPVELEGKQVIFRAPLKPKLETDSKFKAMLHEISPEDALLYNAFNYLLDRGLIAKRNTKGVMGGMLLIGLHLTYEGVDLIESVEQGEEAQKVVKSLFNFSFNFSPTMKVDTLVKAEVGNIVGVGGAVSGKVNL